MGVDLYVLNFLVATHAANGRSLGRTLTLGRQGFHVTTQQGRDSAESLLREHDPQALLDKIQPPGERWADGLLRYLGSTSVIAMDASSFEGAEIVHDLNLPVPDRLRGAFDTIFDGGTIEHIFDIPAVFRNVRAMLAIGGQLLSVNAANDQLGHGLYQFSPELMWRAFGPENGFSVEGMFLTPMNGTPSLMEAPDPRAAGRRLEIGPTGSPTYLFLAARRMRTHSDVLTVHQSDYLGAWGSTLNSRTAADSNPETVGHSELLLLPSDQSRKIPHMLLTQNTLYGFRRNLSDLLEECLAQIVNMHPFMEKFFCRLGGGRELFIDFIHNSQINFERSIAKSLRLSNASADIPPFTHRIWVTTSQDGLYLPPAEYVDNYLRAVKVLQPDAVHFFWTNSDSVRQFIQSKAQAAGTNNVCVMDVGLFADNPLFAKVASLLRAKKYVLAADILKILVLHQFGGIYSDLGVVYDENVFALVRTAQYAFIVGDNVFFQTSFIASAPDADLMSIFLAILNCPAALDRSFALLGPEVGALDEVHIFAGLAFTVCAMLFLPPNARILVLPPQSRHLMWQAQQSWYGSEPKHGNVLVNETGPTVLRTIDFDDADRQFATYVTVFGDIPVLREQIRILLLTQPYFSCYPTAFCRTFFYQGSDKAQSWHNYGYLYNYVLGQLASRVRTMLEVGIGTNNVDMPSNMGMSGTPGASLHAWSELFPTALIIGADVDQRILFQEARIKTYFVDQTDSVTTKRLFEIIGDHRLDLIIDDGLHTFEANRRFFEDAYLHLADDGLYIVEDVVHDDISAWKTFLSAAGYQGAIVQLPNPLNTKDNCLVLITGKGPGSKALIANSRDQGQGTSLSGGALQA